MPKKLPRSFMPKRRLRHRPSDLNEAGMLRRRSVYRITPERDVWLEKLASYFPSRGGWPDRGLALSIVLDWAFTQLGVGSPSPLCDKLDAMLDHKAMLVRKRDDPGECPNLDRGDDAGDPDDPDLDGDGPPTRSPNFWGR